jgi:hypothetical protein
MKSIPALSPHNMTRQNILNLVGSILVLCLPVKLKTRFVFAVRSINININTSCFHPHPCLLLFPLLKFDFIASSKLKIKY